jgi:hypothetical protein
VDLECNAGVPCAYRNRYGNYIFIPDGDSTKPLSHMNTRIADEIDAHANDDQQRRAREAQVSKYLPTGPQSSLFLGVGLRLGRDGLRVQI